MGRIKKAAGPKHEATLSPALSEFVAAATSLPLASLPSHLHTFPARWPFPRGDLYHWIPLLDHFDNILEDFVVEYRLNEGPQMQVFGTSLLEKKSSNNDGSSTNILQTFGPEGDREVVETILNFSKTLMENCGNRSLYNSSDRLGELLNTTSLSLLLTTLRLMARLAQRYHASRQRGANASQHLNIALLSSHYNIDLDNVQKLADVFVKTGPSTASSVGCTPATTPGLKAKDRNVPDVDVRRQQKLFVSGSDMFAAVKDDSFINNASVSNGRHPPSEEHGIYDDWGDVWYSYYQPTLPADQDKKQAANINDSSFSSSFPDSPTPVRRTSGPSRPSRLSISEESSSQHGTVAPVKPEEQTAGGLRTILISHSTIAKTALEEILKSNLSDLPKDSHYDFLNRLRVAKALTQSLLTRRQILAIRILAITNLAYIYPESTLQQKILQQDSDEPRRLQLAYQLAELIHPPGNGKAGIPMSIKTIALGALEALSRHKNRASDVCTALSVNVNHGVLLYVLRKTVADLSIEDTSDSVEEDEWRDALFSLLDALPAPGTRIAESLIGAGLFDILVDVLTMRTSKAERTHPKVLMFMNSIVYTVRDALMTFANSKGLDIVADLISWEVTTSLQLVKSGNGLPQGFKNQVMDYDMPYFQQQTLRWLFKFVNHMMQHGNANFDRLLRNLIDSPQLLSGLRQVLANAKVFGSNVWSGAVNILSSFIHNEPTSYAVIAEAGLSKSFLEAITNKEIEDKASPSSKSPPQAPLEENGNTVDALLVPVVSGEQPPPNQGLKIVRAKGEHLALGILPATDAIVTIPQAFGAICLNTSGLDLFLESGALESFFEIFESPDHVKSMSAEIDLPRLLGNSFDELVRHHPRLKTAVMRSLIVMLARVVSLCRSRAWQSGVGAKLWTTSDDGRLRISGGKQSLLGDIADQLPANFVCDSDEDVVMGEPISVVSGEDSSYAKLSAGTENGFKANESLGPCVSTYINVAAKFLAGFFENNSLCALFIEAGGMKLILDLATLPSLPYDFNNQPASQEIAKVVHMLVEQKPHLVLPSLINRTMYTLEVLEPLISHSDKSAFFSQFTMCSSKAKFGEGPKSDGTSQVNGTAIIKALVNIHTLCNIFYEAFTQPIFTTRATHTLFSQTNLADMYIILVRSLGRVHRACVWEEILLQNSIPDALKEATRIKGYGMGSEEADEVFGFISHGRHITTEGGTPTGTRGPMLTSNLDDSVFTEDAPQNVGSANSAVPIEDSIQLKNVQSIRYLLSQIPSSITPFFQGLGKALVPKRRLESLRQSAYMVAESLAEATLDQLQYELPKRTALPKDRYAYWIVILTSISQLMIEGPVERPHPQCLTLVLQAFKNNGGLTATKGLLEMFFEEVKQISSAPEQLEQNSDGAGLLASAYGGIKIILTFYTQIVTAKYIMDSSQTQGMSSTDRDREHPNYFSANQFLVELRMAVLPVVRSVWDSDFADRASSSILKCMIEILKTILDGEQEVGAFRRADKIPIHSKPQFKPFPVSREKLETLKTKGIDAALAREALYRCVNNREAAEEYCKAHTDELLCVPRAPIPAYDQEREKTPTPSPAPTPQRRDSEATVPDAEHASYDYPMSLPSTASPEREPSIVPESMPQLGNDDAGHDTVAASAIPPPPPAPESPPLLDDAGGEAMSIDNLLSVSDLLSSTSANGSGTAAAHTALVHVPEQVTEASKMPELVVLDDLDLERSAVRRNLIDRALDVLNVHADVTFELADLITTAATKAPDASTMRKEIGETLIQSLISFQAEDDLRLTGKKIASYANLLAIVLQEQEFYDASLEELRSNFSQLLAFVKVFPEQASIEASPWVAQILLVIEKLLAEDVQPEQITWTPPGNDEGTSDDAIAHMEDLLVPYDEKFQLFQTVVEILPHIGKDESLALSVARILVILTRNRNIAELLSEKQNLQRLFVMMKQLAGHEGEKLQSSFMLVLRHIIEDDETVRQIMRSEILSTFETRPSRPTDTTNYVRHMYHLVLRSPSIFVEITNEKLKLAKFDPNQRPQILTLRPNPPKESKSDTSTSSLSQVLTLLEGAQSAKKEDVKPSTEQEPNKDNTEAEKTKVHEFKAPVVEHPDGVVHYLLTQLLWYKDVEDKTSETVAKESSQGSSSARSIDIEMVNGLSSPPPVAPVESEGGIEKKNDKPEFKAEQHPIHVYRCFLLHCLAELLSSYNRAKVEFINFSRKADPKAMTPSKPRSGVLNYLLNVLLSVGTLERNDSIAFRKKLMTSRGAMSVIIALCMRTGEMGHDKTIQTFNEESEPELLFVRKFVLEHALKAFKDAQSSNEGLDTKYARLLCLADLFNKILVSRFAQNVVGRGNESEPTSHKELAKIMFEKNFIAALTASIADIDLNFPGAKRAIKYILEPLKLLTQTAIFLSETSSISTTPGHTDEDQISTASSVSDLDDGREETPDLFRHSTLGMLEPGRDEESSSESSDEDEDMYGDEYDDGMEYEEEMERDGDEVVSDEDEEIEGAGHVEGLPGTGGMDVEVVIDEDDDDDDEDEASEEDDPDDSEDMDEDEEIEIIDEIADDDNESMAEENEEEWQDEDEDRADINNDEGLGGEVGDADDANTHSHSPSVRDLMREMQNVGGDLPGLDGREFADLEMDIENHSYMEEAVRDVNEIDEDIDEDEEDEMDDEDVVYEPDYEDEDTAMPDPPWGWDPDNELANPTRGQAQHHHHPRRIPNPWMFPPGERGMIVPAYRSHRGSGAPRGADDGTNPLLQRASQTGPTSGHPRFNVLGPSDAAASMSDWVHAIHPRHQSEGAVSFINSIVSAVNSGGPGFGTMGGPHGALHFHIGGGNGPLASLPREIQAVLGLRRPMPEPTRSSRDDSLTATAPLPTTTITRWQEEARLLFGNNYTEKIQRVVNSLLKILVPPVIEEEKIKRQQEAEAAELLKKQKEEAAKAAEEARLGKEAAEKEAKDQEEREAAERAAVEAQEATNHNSTEEPEQGLGVKDPDPMEGVESVSTNVPATSSEVHQPEEPSTETQSAGQDSRVRATFRGREVDITGLGIDLEYLDALPDELREEVLMAQLAEQRSQAAASGEEPTDINPEFLEALPPEIREEVLQEEAQARRRREREENRRRAAASGTIPAARAEEMDPASFLASLDPHLRHAVLLEQDEDVLAQLPPTIAAEARALGGDRIMHRWGDMPQRINRLNSRMEEHLGERSGRSPENAAKKPARRQVVQMLDKAGVATLLRLLFVSQQGSSRQVLNEILHNVSQNRQNRAEVVSLLLSILQDGSADISAVERSFVHLSLRAKQPASQKTPQPFKRTLTGPSATPLNAEMTPLMVIQQCLNALVHLTEMNPHIPSFFLTEHEASSSLKSKASKKGKGRETRASKFALNALLSLLDRKLIMESSGCMEQLSTLLQSITQPLNFLLRREKEKVTGSSKGNEPLDPETQIPPITEEPPTREHAALPGASGQSEDTQMGERSPISPEGQAEPRNASNDDVPANTTTNELPDAGEKAEDDQKQEIGMLVKKPRALTPPFVPEYNLRLVVNILAARECSAKTFRDTLSTINNLSALPGAKEIFGNELIRQAQDLGESISSDLDALIPQIQDAETGTDIQGVALSKFSPSSSDQAKLLRVLTALDYLFDPKRNGGKMSPAAEPAAGPSEAKDDLLTTLYENSTFGPLWVKLSECLSTIRQRDNMANVATILLPLVESLMVVCKNATLKDAPLMKNIKEFAVTSPPPESRMENLFFRFTEDHRKILNDLVRHNPRLMSGTFSLLVKNPKVLEFDNKRNYFTRRLHSRGAEARHPQPPLQLSVRRDQVFLDSFKSLYFKTGDEMKYGKLSIRFHGEEGVDAGGVTREWFQVMSRQMFNADYALFTPVASDRTTFHPNKLSHINPEHLMFFKFVGRVIGKALYEGRALDCHFSRAVYKRILGKPVSIKDMETLDLDYYKSLLWMLENDIADIITETFSVETEEFGVTEIVDLVENGRNTPVTEENKTEYVQLVIEYRLTGSVKAQLEEFLRGFHDIVPAELISIFNEQELELLISGLPDIDVDDWKNNTEYHNYQASSPQIQWFWRAVRSFDKEERAKLLQFVTGTSKVPLNGFKELEGMNGFSRFNIHRDYGDKDRLPSSHTCFNQLDLPEYESYEALRQQVYTAMTAGSEYFGFA